VEQRRGEENNPPICTNHNKKEKRQKRLKYVVECGVHAVKKLNSLP
jgi:hypothetical protein